MTEQKTNIVDKSSDGFGYSYASLADIARQSFKIPKMKTGTDNGREYVYWFDEDLKEWLRGAEIVIPDSPKNSQGKDKMNKAQLYGASLTYARRYTVLMADSLATDEDVQVETVKQEIFDAPTPADIKALAEEFKKLYTKEEQVRILNGLKITDPEQIGYENLQKYIAFKQNEIKTNESKGNNTGN